MVKLRFVKMSMGINHVG